MKAFLALVAFLLPLTQASRAETASLTAQGFDAAVQQAAGQVNSLSPEQLKAEYVRLMLNASIVRPHDCGDDCSPQVSCGACDYHPGYQVCTVVACSGSVSTYEQACN